ncbi:phage portal protein [Clostridium sp. MB40-C1]|uniref:phage portal protein n=1 Tax=Clostridium sp. MB40-C1 TaxID=3070996 RepID=UPI0027DED5CF|nr:phage portal protein [Clostridium sp. MB40-C1]WMJ81255.1 phage portal protein [Clostridium sp. MB40-C1]
MFFKQSLEEYVSKKYNNKFTWFEDEVNEQYSRIADIQNRDMYLNQQIHKICSKKNFVWKNKEFKTKKLILDNVKDVMGFQSTYLLGNKLSFTGDENKLKYYNKFYKKGNYHKFDKDIVENGVPYEHVGEYVYIEERNGMKISKSYMIEPCDFYPVYTETNDYVAAIEHWIANGIYYYRVYYEDKVEYWNNEGGELSYIDEQISITGLPIDYKFPNNDFRSLQKLMNEIEYYISKLGDSIQTIILNPILYNNGRQLDNDDAQMDKDAVGYLFNTLGGKLDYANANMDYNTIKLYLNFLIEQFYTKAGIPSIVYGQVNIANVSEVSLKLLYQLADDKATRNEMFFREGLEQRFEKWDMILEQQGITLNDEDVDVEINYKRPTNDTELINNLYKQWEMGAIDRTTIIEKSPLTVNVKQTIERLEEEELKDVKENNENSGVNDNVNENDEMSLQ